MMFVEVGKSYKLAEFRLETGKRRLLREGQPVPLAHRPFQVLLYLLENRERMIARNELLEKFWEGRDAYDEALTKCVGAVRKALNEKPGAPRFIETRWAEGYRFIGPATEERVKDEGARINKAKAFTSSLLPPQPAYVSAPGKYWKPAAVCALAGVIMLFFVFRRSPPANLPAPANSLAVLPLRNLTNNPENDAFSEGLTESLISALAKIEGLKVISGNSAFVFKGQNADPREVGNKLGVANVLEGGVRENGAQIRIEVRLVSAADGQILWSSENYERARSDLFAVQDEIARSVTTRLRLNLAAAAAAAPRHTNNVAAYQAYVKGRYFWKKKTPADLAKARDFFTEAIRLDPNYARAYAGLADYYLTGIWYANFTPQTAIIAAKPAALQALKLDPNLADAHIARARIAEMEWDWETYRQGMEKALELDPNSAHGWHGYAFYLDNVAGRTAEAVTAIKRAAELDPLSVSINVDVGYLLTQAERYDEAVAVLQKTIATDPQFADAYRHLGQALERQGKPAEAADALLEWLRLESVSKERLTAYRAAFGQKGMPGFWRKHLDFLLEDVPTEEIPQLWLAAAQARLGKQEAAFASLERAYLVREPLLVNLKSEYALASLRSDPRYHDLLRRVGLAP